MYLPICLNIILGFFKQLDLKLTPLIPAWPLTPAMNNTLVKDSSNQL